MIYASDIDKLRKFLREEYPHMNPMILDDGAVEVIVAVLAYGIVGRFFPDYAYIYNAITVFSISRINSRNLSCF